MKKVLAFGTFDVVHPGHRYFFQQCRARGDHLTVVVSRNSTVCQVKGRPPVFDERVRRSAVGSLPEVDEAVLGDPVDKHKVIGLVRPDVICLGYDQTAFVERIQEKIKEFGLACRVVRIGPFRPSRFSSTVVKQRLRVPVAIEGMLT